MKKQLALIVTLMLATLCCAQNGINYKAVIKDVSGNATANTDVVIQFTILKTSEVGPITYQENQTVTTDDNGLLIANIGDGFPTVSSFNAIDWASDAHFLKVGVSTGSGLVDMGITEFKAVPYALNVTGLETLDEGNGIGWRLKGINSAFYGDIGLNAMDLSNGLNPSDTRGATGLSSVTMGFQTTASGRYSTAMGRSSNASGTYSTAMGVSNASGDYSTAMGNNSTASGENSVTMGGFGVASGRFSTSIGGGTRALGDNSLAMGRNTIASGYIAAVMGDGTRAPSYSETAIGLYNTDYTPNSTNTNNGFDRLFVVGNGLSFENRSNALTLLKNGYLGLGFDEPNVRLHIAYTPGEDANGNNSNGSIVVGATDAENIAIDNNEIMARNNNATATLNLQKDGGNVKVGGSIVHTSDRRLKRDIDVLPYGLKEILQLQPKAYYWKGREQEHKSLGLIAQDVEPIMANVVTTEDDVAKTLGVSYTELIPVLIKAIQEQQDIIKNQKLCNTQLNEQVSILNNEMKTMLERMDTLESN